MTKSRSTLHLQERAAARARFKKLPRINVPWCSFSDWLALSDNGTMPAVDIAMEVYKFQEWGQPAKPTLREGPAEASRFPKVREKRADPMEGWCALYPDGTSLVKKQPTNPNNPKGLCSVCKRYLITREKPCERYICCGKPFILGSEFRPVSLFSSRVRASLTPPKPRLT